MYDAKQFITSPNGKIAIEYHAEKGFSVIYHSGRDKVKMMSLPEIGLKRRIRMIALN